MLLLPLMLVGCVLDEVPLEGRMCPCVGGFVCDEATNLCVRDQVDAGSPDVGDASDASIAD